MVELRVELISFGTRVGEKSLLVKLFCDLYLHGISIEGRRGEGGLRRGFSWGQVLTVLNQLSAARPS